MGVKERRIREKESLRQEILDLEKANRDLRKDLDALKKKVDAREPASTGKGKKKAVLPPAKAQ